MKGSYRLFLGLAAVMLLTHQEAKAQPTAILTLRAEEVCRGDSVVADILITGGASPYTLIISDDGSDVDTLRGITSPYVYWLKPTVSANFRISSVVDKEGKEGSSPSEEWLAVKPVTPVDFIIEQDIYKKTDPGTGLTSIPSNAVFYGNGVLGSTFYPTVAGASPTPHQLYCIYTAANGCKSRDDQNVRVIHAEAEVLLSTGDGTLEHLCDNDITYEIQGSNKDGVEGLFQLRSKYTDEVLEGHISDEDSSDNMAILDPAGLNGAYVIEYLCEYDILEFSATLDITVADLDELSIEGFPELICSSDDPYPLSPGGIDPHPEAVYTFSGPGVIGNLEEGFFFDPGLETQASSSRFIELEYTAFNGCYKKVDLLVSVNTAPEVSFSFSPSCMPAEGATVAFQNSTTNKFAVTRWEWTFGDPGSGDDNNSEEENPSHFYGEPGDYLMKLTAYTDNGCISSATQDTILPDNPVADFSWNTDCYEKGTKTSFFSLSESEFSQIDSLQWTFKTASDLVLGVITSSDPEEQAEFAFSSRDQYGVQLQVWDEVGCSDLSNKDLSLKPLVRIPANGYFEGFDRGAGQWVPGGDASTWTLGIPDFEGYSGLATDDAWYTKYPASQEEVEHSWVESPCLDLSSTEQPVISMDIMKSFRPGKDGAVLQYNEGMGEGWVTLGGFNSGGQWYNVNEIENEPGGSSVGWSLLSFQPDRDWQLATHDLSLLKGTPHVKFRIAHAGLADGDMGNQGFAFNNIRISEELRMSLLEHFTNASIQESLEADDKVDAFVWQNRIRVIDVQYHSDYPGADPMNQNNPLPAATRSFYYGVNTIPQAILNGHSEDAYRYDFTGPDEELDAELLVQESLKSPSFLIDLEVDWQDQGLEATVTSTCDLSSFSSNIQLYLIVMERMVKAYTGLNGDEEFRNVVLDMLPTSAGQLLGSSWEQGQSDSRTFSWDYASFVEDIDDLEVVAFLTDRDKGGVLGVTKVSKTSTVGIPLADEVLSLASYPNPARDFVYVNTGREVLQEARLQFTDLSGRLVLDLPLTPGYSIHRIDLQVLQGGLYLMNLWESGQLRARTKVVVEN